MRGTGTKHSAPDTSMSTSFLPVPALALHDLTTAQT
jgi:hypothetical protein